jgi:hypothetical protein
MAGGSWCAATATIRCRQSDPLFARPRACCARVTFARSAIVIPSPPASSCDLNPRHLASTAAVVARRARVAPDQSQPMRCWPTARSSNHQSVGVGTGGRVGEDELLGPDEFDAVQPDARIGRFGLGAVGPIEVPLQAGPAIEHRGPVGDQHPFGEARRLGWVPDGHVSLLIGRDLAPPGLLGRGRSGVAGTAWAQAHALIAANTNAHRGAVTTSPGIPAAPCDRPPGAPRRDRARRWPRRRARGLLRADSRRGRRAGSGCGR